MSQTIRVNFDFNHSFSFGMLSLCININHSETGRKQIWLERCASICDFNKYFVKLRRACGQRTVRKFNDFWLFLVGFTSCHETGNGIFYMPICRCIRRFVHIKIQKPKFYHNLTHTHTHYVPKILHANATWKFMRPYVSIDLNMYKMNIKWIRNTFFMSSFSVPLAAVSCGVLDLLLLKLNSVLYIYNSVLFPFGPFCVTRTFSSFLIFHNIRPSLRRAFRACGSESLLCLFAGARGRIPFRTNLFRHVRSAIYFWYSNTTIYEWQTLTRNTSIRKTITIHLGAVCLQTKTHRFNKNGNSAI